MISAARCAASWARSVNLSNRIIAKFLASPCEGALQADYIIRGFPGLAGVHKKYVRDLQGCQRRGCKLEAANVEPIRFEICFTLAAWASRME
jgi:hypothetical protein